MVSSAPVKRLQTLILVFFAAGSTGKFKGGKKNIRDRWFGLSGKGDFDQFRNWWHRESKNAKGADLTSKEEANEAYDDWVSQGRPTVK